jgi:hypothetical protein
VLFGLKLSLGKPWRRLVIAVFSDAGIITNAEKGQRWPGRLVNGVSIMDNTDSKNLSKQVAMEGISAGRLKEKHVCWNCRKLVPCNDTVKGTKKCSAKK